MTIMAGKETEDREYIPLESIADNYLKYVLTRNERTLNYQRREPMYTFKSRVRYSEIGQDHLLSIPSVLNYFQDCSTFQSEGVGLGVQWLEEHKRCWVISSWQIRFLRRPKLGEEIEIGTMPYELKGILGKRNFFLKDAKGDYLVKADSLWTYLDTEQMKPVKVDEETRIAYPREEALEEEWKSRKIDIPEGGQAGEEIPVGKFLLDTNGHVNNEKYVLVAMEYVPAEFEVGYLRVEYKRSAVLGDVMIPMVFREQDRVVVALQDREGSVFAVVEFERGKLC